jgi:hypothetical protein
MSTAAIGRRDRRRRRGRATTLLVVTILAAVAAVACAATALAVRSDTGDLQAHAAPIERRVRSLAASEAGAEHRLRSLRTHSHEVVSALTGLVGAYQAQVDASNHAVDVANEAVGRYNSGQAPIATAFQGTDTTLSTLEERTAAVHTAYAALQTAVSRLLDGDG